MEDYNKNLIDSLFYMFGQCYRGNMNKIFILKGSDDTKDRYRQSKPKENKALPETFKIFKPHLIFEEKYQRVIT
jgi:hypothetical protein